MKGFLFFLFLLFLLFSFSCALLLVPRKPRQKLPPTKASSASWCNATHEDVAMEQRTESLSSAAPCVEMRTVRGLFGGTEMRMCLHGLREDRGISTDIALRGEWEPRTVRFLRRALRPFLNRTLDVVGLVDVGANIGFFSLLVAGAEFPVFAFEPVPRHASPLQQSVDLNAYHTHVRLYRNAVGAAHGAAVHLAQNGSAHNMGNYQIAAAGEPAFMVTLDRVLPFLLPPDCEIVVLKVDVEGYETEVLQGAQRIITLCAVHHIVMEMVWTLPRYNPRCDALDMIRWLTEEHGYTMLTMGGRPIPERVWGRPGWHAGNNVRFAKK